MTPKLLALLALCTTPALAEDAAHPARLEPGDFAVLTHDWNADRNTWAKAGPEVNQSCWQVLTVEGPMTKMELISGPYHPVWSDTAFEPGFQDEWDQTKSPFPEQNPGAAPRALTQGLFTTVKGCPAP